jgi:streptogramin lyase
MVALIAAGFVVTIALATGIVGTSVGRAAGNGAMLTGTIKSTSGEKIEGVTVSARAAGKTFTTSVFTDADGEYYFPRMEEGNYKIWAQAVSFEAGRADINLVGSILRQDFVLKTTQDFTAQLPGDVWSVALTEDTPQDRKMKEVFRMACVGCHAQNFTLQNRFDAAGWEKIIEVMSRTGIYGPGPGEDAAPNPLMQYYKKELAAYLAKNRGPGPSPMKFKPRPRPTGESTLMVVTDYDAPSQGFGLPLFNDGSDWSQGAPDKLDDAHHHVINATLDFDGNIWFTDQVANPYRTIGKVDTKTGKVTDFKVPRADGWAYDSHEITTDKDGIIWFQSNGMLGRIDPRENELETFTPPDGMDRIGIFVTPDVKGKIWCITRTGALLFDPNTKRFTAFKNPTQTHPQLSTGTYGITADSEGNGWWSQYALDLEVKAIAQTGKTTEMHLPERTNKSAGSLFTGDDRKIFDMMGGSLYQGHGSPWTWTPRKPGADPNGDTVWVPAFFGQALIKMDIHTGKSVTYPYPWQDGGGYQAVVDKDHMVWICFQNGDYVAKFDPKTEKFTRYDMPSIAGELHGIRVVTVNGRTEVVQPQYALGTVARLQFRTKEELQSLKDEARHMVQAQ